MFMFDVIFASSIARKGITGFIFSIELDATIAWVKIDETAGKEGGDIFRRIDFSTPYKINISKQQFPYWNCMWHKQQNSHGK